MHYRQQRLQEMARNVVNSRLSFARNFILAEKSQFRSSPLLVAAKRKVALIHLKVTFILCVENSLISKKVIRQ